MERSTRPSRLPAIAVIAALVVVSVPLVVMIVRVLRTPYLATSDFALIELRVADVGGGNTPLVGVYSRFGWNHPGPLLFYVLALPYRVLGADGPALRASGVLVNLVAAAGGVVLFARRARRGALPWVGLALESLFGFDHVSPPSVERANIIGSVTPRLPRNCVQLM